MKKKLFEEFNLELFDQLCTFSWHIWSFECFGRVVKITAKPASVSSLRHKQLPLTSTIALFQPPPPIADLEPEPGSNIDEWPETDVIRQRAFSAWYEQKKAQNLKTLKVLKEKMAEEKEKEEEVLLFVSSLLRFDHRTVCNAILLNGGF